MKMKLSRYNHYVDLQDKQLIFNSITDKYAVTGTDMLEKIKRNIFPTMSLLDNWIMNGFIVPDDLNENILASSKLNTELYKSSLHLTILASEGCNFKCKYCFDTFNGINIQELTIRNLIQYLQREVRKYTEVSVDWFGGEPLLAKESIYRLSDEFITICKATSRPYSAVITTNGYLLDNMK